MPTPIRRRFSVQTLLQDKAATGQTLDHVMLLVDQDTAPSPRYITVSLDDWSETLTEGEQDYEFAETFFSQELKPETLSIVYRDVLASPETVAEALDDAVALGLSWYWQCYAGVTDSADDIQAQQDLAAYGESFEDRVETVLMTQDVNAYDAGANTDIGALLRAISSNRASVIFHPASVTLVDGAKDLSKQRPDAAILGRMTPTTEGAEQWDWHALVGVSDSNLTAAQQNVLSDQGTGKGYNFIEQMKNTTFIHMFRGRTVTDREIRIQWGADWHDVSFETGLANYAFQNPLMAFDDETFADAESIAYQWRDEALSRRIIVNTAERPAVIKFPDPDTIDASTRASGVATLNDVYDYYLNSAIDEWKITGNWRLGQ